MRPEPISLLMVSNAPARAGVEEHILQLLRGLDRRRFRLHLVCTPELFELYGDDLPEDVHVSRFTLDHLTHVGAAYQLIRLLRERRIAILHSHTFRASLLASPLGRLSGVPVIIETDHVREVWRKGWRANYWIDRCGARFVDRIIAVSGAIARYLIETKHLPAGKITVIRTAADLTRFRPGHLPPPGMKRALGFSDSDPVLILVGRLEPQKGHRVLFEALPSVMEEFPQVRLVCLGEGSMRPELEAIVAHKGLGPAVRFVGFQRDVLDWLALADLAVLPSFYEGLPMSAIESLAACCPIVATAVDGTPEVVLHEKTGLLIPPGDPGSLAAAIRSMLRNPARAHAMARAGREFVVENFSVAKLIQGTQDLYLDACEQRQQKPRPVGSPDMNRPQEGSSGGAGFQAQEDTKAIGAGLKP